MRLLKSVADNLPESASYTAAPEGAKLWKCLSANGKWNLCQKGRQPVEFTITVHEWRADSLPNTDDPEIKEPVVDENPQVDTELPSETETTIIEKPKKKRKYKKRARK